MKFKFIGMVCLMLIISVNISLVSADETNITLVSNLLEINENVNNEIEVLDGYAYTFCTDGLVIFDVKDPSSPIRVGTYVMGISGQIAVSDGYAYALGSNDLVIIDVKNPSSPTLAGSYDVSGDLDTSEISDIEVSNGFAYIASYTDGILIIDTTNPSSPTFAGSYATGQKVVDIEISDNLAYISLAENGFEIVDVSNPSSPNSKGTCDCGYAGRLAVSDGYAYILSGFYDVTLIVIDISTPSSPTVSSSFDMADYLSLEDITVEGDYAYVAENDHGFDIIDISNPLSPALAGSYRGAWAALAVEVSGDYVYLSDAYSSILHVEKSNVNPTPVEAIGALQENIDCQDINDGIKTSLNVKVDNALKELEKGDENKAIKKLEDFISFVSTMETAGKLTESQADELIDEASSIIVQIQSSEG